jgi:hypothetical protein
MVLPAYSPYYQAFHPSLRSPTYSALYDPSFGAYRPFYTPLTALGSYYPLGGGLPLGAGVTTETRSVGPFGSTYTRRMSL